MSRRIGAIAAACAFVATLGPVRPDAADALVVCAKPRRDGSFSTALKLREVCKPGEVNFQTLEEIGVGGGTDVYTDLNYQDVPVSTPISPGTIVATVTLPPGRYVVQAKLRFREFGGVGPNSASCVFYPPGSTSGLDSGETVVGAYQTANNVLLATSSGGTVSLECFAPAAGNVHVINSHLVATRVDEIINQ